MDSTAFEDLWGKHPVVETLTRMLVAAWIDREQQPGPEHASHLARVLMTDQVPPPILAVVTGGTYAAFRPNEPLDDEVSAVAIEMSRSFLTDEDPGMRVLAAMALMWMVDRGWHRTGPADLVTAATVAHDAELRAAALKAVQLAISRSDEVRSALSADPSTPLDDGDPRMLSPLTEAHARVLIARISTLAVDLDHARRAVMRLPDSSPQRHAIEALLDSLSSTSMTTAASAIRKGDRIGSAGIFARALRDLLPADSPGDHLLSGLVGAFDELAKPDPSGVDLRRALSLVLGHIRDSQRFGYLSEVGQSGIDMVLMVLLTGSTPATTNVLAEFLEGLADAGLSEIDPPVDSESLPSVVTSQLRGAAQFTTMWPDMEACLRGLGPNGHGLVFHVQTRHETEELNVVCAYIRSPGGVAFKRTALSEKSAATVAAFASEEPNVLAGLRRDDVDQVVTEILPVEALHAVRAGQMNQLVITPDGPLWSLPWQSAPSLQSVTVALTPSFAFHAKYRSDADLESPIRTVLALVDETIPGSELLTDQLRRARAAGLLDCRMAKRVPGGEEFDLLLIYGHGAGNGLEYGVRVGDEVLSPLSVSATARARQVVVASCGSASRPPVHLPVGFATSMLMKGTARFVGGLWPLPVESTAKLLGATIAQIAQGRSLRSALEETRLAQENVLAAWGLAVYGQ